MPTPLGHALAGVAGGCLALSVAESRRHRPARIADGFTDVMRDRRVVACGLCGALPDIDFVFGLHSGVTHSVGATVVVGLVGAWWGRGVPLRCGAAVALSAAYGSHVLLDWLGSDTVAPLGVMALWPFSIDYYLSDQQWFLSVCREYRVASCWWHNLLGITREVLLMGPTALLGAVSLRAVVRTTR